MEYFQLTEQSSDRSWGVVVPPSQFENQETIWHFSDGKTLDIPRSIRLDIDKGEPTDFSLTGFSIAIVSNSFRQVLETSWSDEIQFIRTTCGQDAILWILNVLHSVDCIDYDESSVQLCTSKGKAFRHRYGKPEMISRLVIDKSKVEGRHIFRIADWRPAIIVSEAVRNAVEQRRLKGVAFIAV